MDQITLAQSISVPQNLTNWKNEPTLLALKTDLEAAKPSHQNQMLKIDRWNDLREVKGKARPPEVKGRSKVQPKLIRTQAEWRYSALTEPFNGTQKLFKISPATWEDKAAADQNELVLNHQFRTQLNRIKLIDDFVRTTVDEGTCVLRTGWKRSTVMVTETVTKFDLYPITQQEQLDVLQQAIALRDENPRAYEEQVTPDVKQCVDFYDETGEATYAVPNGTEEVKVEKILENKPTVDVLDPHNVIIDPSCCGDLNKAMFVVVSFETSHSELKKEGKRYKNLDQVIWDNNSPATHPEHYSSIPDNFQFNDKARKKVIAYEYWGFYDIHKDGTLSPFVATWIGNVLIRMELNPFPDEKLPFVVVPYLPLKRELWGETDAELLEDNQAIAGAVTRGMIDLMGRSANGQQGIAKGMLDPMNRRRYDNGQDYEFNPNFNPTTGVIEHKFPEIPQSAMLMLGLQNQQAESITGVKAYAGGISGEALGDVAAGIRGVLDAASKREMAILRRMAQGMTEVAKKIISMNSEFLSDKEVIRITNEEFVTVNREDLKGNFDLITDISTAEVDNAQAQDLGFMLQTMGPNMDPSISMMILAEIARLKRLPELSHTLANYKPQPDPITVKKQELEIKKLEMEIAELDSKILLNQAKAAEAAASKDKMDLDYVEQETGTKHARDMQKQQGQAEGNQTLEVTKALLKPTKPDERKPDIEAAVGYNAITSGQLP
jgi:hypothetical protein